jgi:uncharacterized protein
MTPLEARFDSLSAALIDAGSASNASELHGGLTGVLCVGGPDAVSGWLEHSLQHATSSTVELHEIIDELTAVTWQSLLGTDMQFAPIVPDDDATLDARVRGLADWCDAFVAALGVAGLRLDSDDDVDAELREVIEDLAAISMADDSPAVDEDVDRAEFDFAQIAEFVRVGVQLVFEILRRRATDL